MTLIVNETNLYRQHLLNWGRPGSVREYAHKAPWTDVTVPEMYVWLAYTMLMAHVKKHDLKEYWSRNVIIQTPIFGKYMSRDRYRFIYKYLHFTTSMGPVPNDRLYKFRHIMSLVQERFTKFFKPYQKLVIDESLVLFRGRLSFIQYIPSKRHRFGLKFFVLCDCKTGYVLDFIIYTGTDVDIRSGDPHGFSGAVVKTLMDKHFKQNHILYTDNYYTSPALTQYLLQEETGTCGTVRKFRKHWPAFPDKQERGTVKKKECGPMLALQWVDKRPVNILTTVHTGDLQDSGRVDHHTQEPVKKPDAVIDYNINMRLVDKSDMMVSDIDCLRKTRKWYRKAFLHILDLVVLNCHILHQQLTQNTSLSLRLLERQIISQLFEKFGTILPRIGAVRDVNDRMAAAEYMAAHKLVLNPLRPSGRAGFNKCQVCMYTSRRDKKRTETKYRCAACNVALCPVNCFAEFHSLENY